MLLFFLKDIAEDSIDVVEVVGVAGVEVREEEKINNSVFAVFGDGHGFGDAVVSVCSCVSGANGIGSWREFK